MDVIKFLRARIAEDEATAIRLRIEAEAKRRVVEHAEACRADRNRRDDGESRYREMWWTCVTLAKVYADHPDHREEWKL